MLSISSVYRGVLCFQSAYGCNLSQMVEVCSLWSSGERKHRQTSSM